MSVSATFDFAPLQMVTITAYDLNVKGRIMRCIFDPRGDKYDVEYCINSDIRRGEFLADELQAA